MIPSPIIAFLDQILGVVLRVLGVVTGLQGLVQAVEGNTVKSAQETTAYLIQDKTNAIQGDVENTGYGLFAIKTLIDTNQAALLAAIGSPMQAGSTIPLPPTPPPGYGGASTSDVWSYVLPLPGEQAQDVVGELWDWLSNYVLTVSNTGNSAFGILNLPSNYTVTDYASGIVSSFLADLAVVTPADTLLSWLQRQNPTWTFIGPTHGQIQAQPPAPYYHGFNYFVTWSEPYFQLLKTQQLGAATTTSTTAPVWPGLGNVAIGASLALADGLLVPGPLDGVILAITAVAYPVSFYPFGPLRSYVKVGGIAFVDDNGQAESAQPLGMDTHVVCPQTMVRADHAYIRLQSGTVGTVQAWTTI